VDEVDEAALYSQQFTLEESQSEPELAAPYYLLKAKPTLL